MSKSARHTTKADETPEFLAFWDVWQPHMHRNDGRGAARDEFVRHVERYGADPQDIADGAAWYIRSRDREQFIPHAATWLNRRAYEDGAEKEREFRARQEQRPAADIIPMRRAEPKPMSEEERERRERFIAGLRRVEG
jgi:hypothetical protein